MVTLVNCTCKSFIKLAPDFMFLYLVYKVTKESLPTDLLAIASVIP